MAAGDDDNGRVHGNLHSPVRARAPAIRAQALLFVPILGFDLVWLYFYREETNVWTFLTRPAVVLIAWVGTAIAAVGALWYRRHLRRERESLLRLRRELEDR